MANWDGPSRSPGAAAIRGQHPATKGRGLLSYAPNFGEIAQNGIAELLMGVGVEDRRAHRYAGRAFQPFNDLTPIGDAVTADEASQAYRQGSYGKAAALGSVAAVGMIPLAGDALAKGAKPVVKRMFGGNRAFPRLPLQMGRVTNAGHTTEPGFVYRTMGQGEFNDARGLGQFLAKPNARYGGEKQWVAGGNGAFFNPNAGNVVVRIPNNKFTTGRPVYFGDAQVVKMPPR